MTPTKPARHPSVHPTRHLSDPPAGQLAGQLASQLAGQLAGQPNARQLQSVYHLAFLRGELHPVTLLSGSDTPALVEWVYQLAQLILCEKNGLKDQNACGVCGACVRVQKHASESILHVKPEGLQLKIEDARKAIQFISLQSSARVRILIFERADLLNIQAANTLLKTLEEPPARTLFFLVSPSSQDVLITLRSRAQMMKLRPDPSQSGETLRPLESQSPDWKELRLLAVNLLKDAVARQYHSFFARWKAEVADREAAIDVVRLWQELLRDLFFLKLNPEAVLHQQEVALLAPTFENSSAAKIQDLFQLILRIEVDIRSNVERNLALEPLWQYLSRAD